MAKQSTSFYLSDQAHANLEAIAKATGTNKTAVVELALALLANHIKGENTMKSQLQNSLADPDNTYSVFIMALIQYLLEKDDHETQDFLTQIDNNGTPDWDLLYKWSTRTTGQETIDINEWVQSPESFLAWMRGNRHYVSLAIDLAQR